MLKWNRNSKLISLAVVGILLLFFLHYIKVLRPVENVLIAVTKPAISATYRMSNWVGQNYLDLKSKRELSSENTELKDQLAGLLKEKSLYLAEREENVFLKQQLDFVTDNNFDFEIAEVIGRNADNTQNSLIIGKGTKHGMQVGQPVVSANGFLIGKINKVGKNSSIILLINDDLSKVAAKIQNQSKTIGLVEGEFGLGIMMNLIPQTEMVREEDVVVTSGLEKGVPANIVIGMIDSVTKEPEELFQTASIHSIIDFGKITLVNVIKE